MEMQDKPLRKLYTSLKSNNYDVPDNYESFERTLTESGQSGAQSRRALHESLKKNNYDVPDSYDSFYKSLFTPVNSTTSMAIGSEPVKPAPQKPTTSTTTGTPQHTVQPTKPAPAQPVRPQQVQKPQGKPMTAAQKAAAIGWAQGLTAQTKANTQRAMQKIKNIGKYQKAQGAYGQTKKGNIEYNPKAGKMEQTYLTPQGEQTTHKATADLASHEFRVQQGFLSRMSDNGLNPDNPEDVAKQRQLDKEHPIRDVLDSVWKEAEGIDKQAQEELRSKASSGFSLSTFAEASNSAGAPLAGHDRNFNDELSYQEKRHKAFDFDKMANTIYSRLPKDYRNDRLREYTAYFSKHPKEAKGKSAVAAAKDALMGQIYNNVYSHAVQERLPKSNLEFLLRKVADQPLISSKAAAEFAASSRTGSHGLEVAERDAMAQFGSQHKAMNIMGTVANMALDPITYVSGGVGGFVGKKALGVAGKAMLNKAAEKATEKAVGKVATDVASRYAAGTLAGRVAQGVAGGAANFATFNTLKGIEEQVQVGGVVNPETGKSEGFSVGEILKSTGHGLLLGAATGTLSPIIGNFADKAVKATTSTVGKVALRAGETAVSTLAEGTVFSIPEWISGQGDAFDVWTDNMGMMLGFKASHAIKSAPRVLDALRTDGKRYGFSFKERLNKQMEASPSDVGFTSEELDELRNNGYMDLSMLFRNAQKQKGTSPKSHEVSKEVVDDYENLTPDTFDGYEAMKRLMNDKGVSEATRAKAYYILTGRMLPMSTITGYTTDKTEDGDIVVKSMSAQGDVVTSRQFTNEKAAQGEIDKIMRQSELNSVDVGEKYKETASNMLVVETAIKEVAPDADMETVLQNYRKVKSGQEDMPQELIDQAKAIDAAIERNRDIADANRPEAIRAKLNKETGLDVDATLRKMPKDRTEEEKGLVDTYIKSLFPEQEKTEDGPTADVQADTEYKQRIEERQQAYDEGKEAFNVADTEGDNSDADAIVLRYREAYDEIERVFADDAEMRIAQLEEDPWEVMNDQSLTPEQQDAVAYFVNSKAAMDGLTEAANENSENKRAEAEHKIAQRTNKQSGMIHPATLKVDDKQVYIVSGNVTMFPDGSAVDIHHSSESVVVCDAETGELKFISPEQIYKVDEPVDPSMELKAVDEAINAEQQAILGNEAETEVSETEEMPEQEENGQPQAIQQDDAVEEMNLDVQNEDEVNLPQNEDLQPSNETIEDDLPQQPETALQRIPKGENGEPLLEQTDPETAWDGVVEYMEDADDAQEYVESMVAQLTKDVENAKKAVSKVKPSADMAKFKADKAAARQIQADAEARLDKWLQISNVNKARKQSELNRINAERAEADRIAREKAVAELAEQKRVEAEKKAEQEAIGAHAVNPKIKEKWDAAPKIVGNADVITLPDGSKLRGHYVLTEAGAATASHDVNNAYKPTEGFPIDENGQSVNDRDYERDEDARKISRSIADNYDSRALQSVTVVDNNGITLSGNGRNIAGELAAQQGTDGAYIDYLREFPQKYGLTAEQVQSMQHPRVHFVPDEVLPYDAATFARFNAQEMKSQSKPEAAVKLGKVVPDNTFGNIVRSLAQYDRLSDFYANEKDANGAIMELVKAGVVNDKQLPELRTGDALSATGRELLENTLIGKVFQSNPDAVRQIIAQPGIKQSIVMALSEIAHNRTLANGYDLSEELSNAVDLVARAKQADPDTYKEGMPVSPFGRQQGLFDDELGDKRVTDATTLLLADILNSTKPSDLRKVLATYNAEGETAANGQLDIFSGDLRNKEEILTDINKHFINATAKEQQALVDAAIAERKRRAAEAAATEQSGGNDTAEQAASVETSSGQPQPVPVEGTPIGETSTPDEVQEQREQTETNPTEAQKEAGNYRKGHIKVDGYDIALENPKGSTRSGKDTNGKEWSITMKHDYGYIRGTKGTDGDHIDVYLSDNPTAGNVYVVDQIDQQTGNFDEHKVMYGFDSMDEAVQAYRDQYEDGWKVGNVTEVSREEFKKWVDSSARKTKPFADYKTVKPLETEHTQSGENYAHNSEEIMHEDVKPAESSEKYTITPTQYTNKKGKTSDMYLVKFNHELSKEEKAAAKTFISEPLAEGKRTPRGWYDREQGGYMVRSEEAAKQLGDMMADEIAVADEQPVTAKDYRNAVAPTAHDEQEKKPANTVTVEDAAIQDVEAKVYKPESEKEGLQFNGDVSKEDFNDALKDLRSLLGVSDDEGDVGILFRDGEELTKEQRKKIKAAGLSVTQVLVDNGMVKFSDYAGKMISLIGDKIRPWLKSFYEGIRWEPGYESVEFTPSDEVARFDVQNFDKPTPDVLKQAEMVVAEQKAAKISKQTEQEVKTERNEKRKEDEKQTEANTAAITEEAGAVASKARTVAKRATVDTEVRKATEEVEAALEKVNNQLALLGYYEAEKVAKDFNETYGYMRNAEKKAVKDATTLAKRIADDLGVDMYEATHMAPGKNGKRKSKPLAVANIAPIGGDITIHLPMGEGKNLSIYVNLKSTDSKGSFIQGDNLEVGRIMYRLENPAASGQEQYGVNNFADPDITYNELIEGINRVINSTNKVILSKENVVSSDLPEFNIGDKVMYKGEEATLYNIDKADNNRPILDTGLAPIMYEVANWEELSPVAKSNKEIIEKEEKVSTEKENPTKKNNSKNNSVSLNRESTVGDLFGDLFSNNDFEGKHNEDNQRTRRENRKSDDGVSQRESSERRTVDNKQLDRDIEERRSERQGDKRVQSRNAEERSSTERPSGRLSRLNVSNNHAERGVDYAPTSVDARIEANIKAIELANELVESSEKATPEQMSVLRKFSGWGGLGKAFNQASYSWSKDSIPARLQTLLGAEGYEQAVMSANSAYYTPAYVIDTLWDIAKQLGFKGGNILEGSAGIGNILGLMPMDISDSSRIQAVEIDGTSGNILSLLYPEANVNIQGFEQTRVPNGSVDLAITNVPFVTGLRVNDTTGDGDLSKKFHNIHDFCIAKNVRKLREGGIGIFISSNGTLDSSQKLRDWLVSDGNADVVGAFRLNNKTFGGTGVTSDIIVIRKRVNGQVSPNAIDVSTVTGERSVEFDTGETKRVKGVEVPVVKHLSMDYNKYFIEHPEMMAGKMEFAFEHGDKYRATSKGLYPTNDKAQDKLLADFVQSFTNMKDEAASTKQDVEPINVYEELGNDVKEGSMLVNKDGQLCVAQLGQAVPLNLNTNKVKGHTKEECFKAYTEIKQALNDVLKYQTENEGNEGLQPLLDKLNKAYDSFVDTYGRLNKNTSIAFLRNDVDYPNVFSLEKYEEKADKNGNRVESFHKTDIFKKRVVEKSMEPQPKNVKDGIVVSVYKFGKIDIPYISNKLGKTEEDVKHEIIASGLGFENPVSKQVEVSYQYLSGNVREKLKQAEENNEGGEYNTNIKALKEVVPNSIPAHLIEFNLGSSWIAPELYEEYVKDKTDVDVKFTAAGGTWFMKEPHWTNNEKNRSFGVHSDLLGKHVMGHELIEAAIQNKTITVSTTRKLYNGTTETITDKEATQACSSRIDEIRQEFKDWARNKMQSNPEMSDKIEQVYNDLFNNYVPIDIPSEYIPEHFGGATHNITLRPHQAKAVVRGTMQPLMLAHEVGTGKTFTLISTAMEMRRLGTARKPMIVVQNATVGQFVASAKELYPNAKILTLEDSDRNAEGRKNFYAKIRYNDWDMIVVPQSTFEFIPDSEERQMTFIQDKIEEKLTVLAKMKDADKSGRNLITRQAEKEVEQLKEELADLTTTLSEKRTAKDEKKRAVTKQNTEVKAREMLERRTDETENFDDMGIDALLIDEAHEYKHLGFATAMQRGVKGVDPSYSKKSQGVFLKTQAVLQKSHGRNVIFATGTPISNTAAEIWAFMRYLMPSETMKEYGIYYFDDFVRNFGNIQQMLEFTTSGKFRENNRFAGYIDLPELVRIWSSVSDTVRTKDAGGVSDKIPKMEGDKDQDLYLPQTPALRGIMKYVKAELEAYDKMSGKDKKENSHIPLTMYSIAKAAAVDARLVDETAEDDSNSKTNEAVRQTLRSLKETASYNGTVALFADNYQNKTSGFNLYEDVKDKLIAAGIPEKQIVVMKSGMTVKKKLEIFDKVNRGEVRVIMGSTFTLGTGVNIQERLHTLIHIDAPNRPMDYTQRNGRILRQGNIHKDMNKPVRVLRFGVEDSLDVTAYQRLKTKGAIADSIMKGKQLMANSMENRILEEEEDSFGDTVAQLSGSEYAMLKNQAEKNVRKYESRKRQWESDQTYIHNAKPRLNGLIKNAQLQKEENEKNLSLVNNTYPDGKFKAIIVGKHKYDSVAGMEDFFKEHNKKIKEESEKVKNGTNATYGSTINVDIDGLTFAIHTEVSKEMSSQGINLFAKSTRTMTYSQKELGLEDVPVKGALMRNAIEDITDNIITGNDFKESIERATQNIAHYSSDLEHILSREGKPFEFESELEEAKAKFVEYTEAMKKEMEEKEKKYAEMDKNIDANSNLSNIEYEDGNFSELTAEEPLFNVSSSIRSFIEGNLFSEVDFSDSPNKNVNQAISKLTDDELLKEIAKGDSKEWNFYMEEYDRRHNKEFQEAVERYMNSLEDEKTSLDTAYGSYVNVAKNWSNGGYHTTERTLLRAQLDAIEDYVSKKESEQLSSVESEAYHQAKETVRKVGYDLTRLRLRPLEEGEACHVERRYTESNGFSFTGKDHIESIEDIAYIFKQLETSSVENSFLVLIKDGTPTVLHLSIGSYATALAPIEQAIVAADAINPDKVLFVHNHPSGNISASKQDMDVQKKMKEIFGGKVMPAIIINTTSGKFGMFSEDGRLEDGNIPLPDEHNNIPINVYQFSQQVFAKDWNPEFAFRAVSPESIAEYVSSHRLGEHKKMSLIILDQAGHVTGNVFLPWTKLTDVDSHKNIMQIISYVNQMGGRSAILYGNYELGEDTRDTNKSIFKIKTAFSNSALHLMDVINIDDSALDRGAMEEDVEYGKRNLDEEVNEQFNRELSELTEENADTKIFNLGSPSSILLSAGVEDKPMKLYGNKVIKKMKKHGFALTELKDLPHAVSDPIAVFDNYQREGNRSILTELRTQQGNFLISVNIGKDADVDFNIVRSVFGKGDERVVDWINNGLATYINKEKALSFLSHQSAPIAATAANAGQGSPSYISASALNADATYKNELSTAANIVNNFVNPNIVGENSSLQSNIAPQDTTPQAKALQAKILSDKLNTPIRVVSSPNEIAELPSHRQQRAKGWWSAKNDEVVILLPNNADVADVANTVVHEVVGHKGLRKLVGEERFDEFLDEVYDHATNPIRTAIDEAERKLFDTEVDRLTQQKNAETDRPESRKGVFSRAEATVEANKKREQMRREATEEYMADMAGRIGDEGFEKMSAEELTFWGKVKAKVQQFLDKFLRGLKIAKGVRLTDKDVAYILYKSWKNLRNGGKPTIMDAAEDALMRNKTNYNKADISRFRDGDMGLDETITSMKAEISAANKDDFNAKVEAMKAIGGNLQKLRSAMSRQRSYDISTAKAMTDLAQVLLDKGLLDNLSVYETKRVLSAVRNGVGKEDISGHVQKLMDIMVDNQLHSGANMLGKLFTMRGTRLNDRGIEVQGNLDPQGQILVKTARKYTSFPKEEIDNTLIPDLMSRMGSDDQTIADNAAIEYAGAQIARRYVEEITESKAEEKALRESIKTAKEDKDAGKLDAEAYKQYVNATEEAIRQNKIDRAEAYSSIAAEFGGMLGESAKRAKEWREAEQKRINDIHHNCNSDMEGRITDEHHKDNKVQKLMNNSAIRFLLAPLGTFDQMLRMFGKKNVNGEGYLWNRFMRSWVDATENEYTGYRDDLKELDAKVSEVYGKKMKWADLFTLERKMEKVPVEFWDGGERKLHELTQGNLLYIYMVDKMSDGRMKLRYMGITEQDVQHITEILDPKFKELADWLQDEYLVNKRNKYNEVHKRMFGAPMAAIDNYFPLKILKNALDKEEDVAEDDNAGIVLPGTTTNGIIKRTRNNKPLDVTGADAFNVIADHLQEMEHWAAFAELTRDINTMLSYKRFRNQVMNMSSAYGAGAVLWKNFRSVCKMAVGAYRPPIAELDKTAVNVAKGVTAAKVSFRVFTALKQFLSFPAYLPDASLAHLAKDVVNPVNAWNWSMKNLPIFEKRWQSRMAGDPRLMKSDMDWKAWRSRIVEIASMIGMSPNAFVDALTVAMGAHAMYQSRYAKYKRWGFDEVTADKRAKQDATILYNSTQQSSEGAFLSPMQVDRSWLSVLFTVFRNSSISYKRQEYDAWRNEVKLFTPGYRQQAEEFMIKQLQREGLTEEQAKKAAHEELRKGPLHNLARIFVFGFLLQYTWNLGAYLPYLILGDDDDEKSKMTDDALTHALFGSLEGLTSGDVLSQAGNMALQGEGNWSTVTKDMPLVSDLSDILKTFSKDNVEALNDCINLLTQSAVGVNPQSITDALVAIMDYCGDDAQTSRECALLMARILNCPQSQLDKIYFDELSASGVEASKMTPSQIAERFARYKRDRSAPLTGWMYSDAAIADKDGKRKETVYKKARENFKAAASKSNKEELEQWKAEYKETAAKLSAIKKLREQDEDEADEQMDALENTPEYDRYLIMKDYNSDMNDITKAWLNSKSPTEREQLTKAMFKVQQEMVNELKTSK